MDIETLAVVAGHARWLESALFETLGSWLADTPEANVREYFGVQCQRRAWHGELWAARQPISPGVDAEAHVVSPNVNVTAAVAAMREPTSTAERLAGIVRFALPRLSVRSQQLLADVSTAVDAPTGRVLTLVLRDDLEAWQEGEQLLQGFITPASVAQVHAHVARLEALLLG